MLYANFPVPTKENKRFFNVATVLLIAAVTFALT